jgi:branched-chain amino acid transport system ATP-binding protein
MMPLLEVQGLQAFYGPSQILHNIDLSIAPGQQLALLGRNGMGKTTLIRSLMGLVADRRGKIHLAGADIAKSAPEEIARIGVALVPEGRGIFGTLSVVENLVMAARPGLRRREPWTLERVFSLFPRLKDRRKNGGHQLSGGEQQMLAMGRALMTNPDLILIDEATEGLAPLVAQEIWRTLAQIGSEGIATIIVDKDFRNLSKLASHTIVLSKGEVVYSGTPGALANQPAILEKYLGV